MPDVGTLQVSLVSNRGKRPITDAAVEISSAGEPDKILEVLKTDLSGQTEVIELETPPLEYSMEPGLNQPYSEYNLKITAPGFEPVEIAGSQMLSGQLALQNLSLEPTITETASYEVLAIGPHTLYGDYPPKIAESEVKDIQATGEVVLSRVVIPEYVIVHDGAVSDNTAKNYYVLYKDYIKNVASCEIYSTWPKETLRANILAIMSFTLNRVYTEWYRSHCSFMVGKCGSAGIFFLLFKVEYRDPEDSYYDEAEFAIVKGNTVFGNLMDDVRFYGELALVRGGIEKIHEALPDYKYVPMRDVREAMYPEKMTTEQLAEAVDEIAEAFDPYEYRDNVEIGENTVQEVMLDLRSGNIHSYISYLKDIVDEECDQSVRAGVLMERLKAYEPELPKDMEPMVYVNYCEESGLMNPRCQKLSDLDSKTVEQDKVCYADRAPNTNEPKTIAQMFFTVYYAEKGDQMLHHFKGKIDIGTGNGGLLNQLKLQNEMRLTDESWINYQKGKGNEEFQKYMEDLTDMQNHVLPYLQSFCSLEKKECRNAGNSR